MIYEPQSGRIYIYLYSDFLKKYQVPLSNKMLTDDSGAVVVSLNKMSVSNSEL